MLPLQSYCNDYYTVWSFFAVSCGQEKQKRVKQGAFSVATQFHSALPMVGVDGDCSSIIAGGLPVPHSFLLILEKSPQGIFFKYSVMLNLTGFHTL